MEMSLGPRPQPHPDQTPACVVARLESAAAVSGSSIAAAFSSYTCHVTKKDNKRIQKIQDQSQSAQSQTQDFSGSSSEEGWSITRENLSTYHTSSSPLRSIYAGGRPGSFYGDSCR